MSEKPTVHEALTAVMEDVQAVRKGDVNRQQGYSFRGIDAVVNAVGPALRKHGVIVVPVAEDLKSDTYTSKAGAMMRNVTVRVRWVFYGPAGDSIEAVSFGEAADAGDKAVAKAHSVAYRVVLLQALCIPTDEPDPDSSAHERAVPQSHPAQQAPTNRGRQSVAEPEPSEEQAQEYERIRRMIFTAGDLGALEEAGKAAQASVQSLLPGQVESLKDLGTRRRATLERAANRGES